MKEEDIIGLIIIIKTKTKTPVIQDIVDVKCYENMSWQDPKVKA